MENILQAIDDKQTQTLPSDEEDRQRIIFATRSYLIEGNGESQVVQYEMNTWQDFLEVLSQHQRNVRAVFNELIGEEEEEADEENEKLSVWKDILHYEITQEELNLVLQDYPVAEQDYSEIFQRLSSTFQDWVKRAIGVRGREVYYLPLSKIGLNEQLGFEGERFYVHLCQKC